MYTYVRALAVKYGINQRWLDVNISTEPTSTLLRKYRKIYVVLKNTAVTETMTLDLDKVAAGLQAVNGTISDYLTANGNKTLPVTMGNPTIVRNNAIFSDAFEADFHVDTIDYTVGEGVEVPKENRFHLVIRPRDEGDRQGYDYLTLRKRVLTNVNGFYHRSAADSRGLYALDGNKTSMKSNKNYMGLLSFGTIGDLGLYDLKSNMLSFEKNQATGLVEKVHVKFPFDLTGKTPIMILGGYLLMVDDMYCFMSSPNIMTLKTVRYPFLERYFESRGHLDFSAFDLSHVPENDAWINDADFRSESFLRGYFTMSQSFLVVVPTDRLVADLGYPETQTCPHRFISYEKPVWPLVAGSGKHEVYWSKEEAGQWMIHCDDTYRYNRAVHGTAAADRFAVDDKAVMNRAGQYGPAWFLKLFTEDIKIKTK